MGIMPPDAVNKLGLMPPDAVKQHIPVVRPEALRTIDTNDQIRWTMSQLSAGRLRGQLTQTWNKLGFLTRVQLLLRLQGMGHEI